MGSPVEGEFEVPGGKRWESASATVSRLLSVKVNVLNDLGGD
jgi:hypothetical protein